MSCALCCNREKEKIRRKQDVIIIWASKRSPKRTGPLLRVGTTNMGQTLQTKRVNTWMIIFVKFYEVPVGSLTVIRLTDKTKGKRLYNVQGY